MELLKKKKRSPLDSLPGRSLYIHRCTDHYFPWGQILFLNLGFSYSFQTNNYCRSIRFRKTDHPQIRDRQRRRQWVCSSPFHSQCWGLIEIFEKDSEMSKMNHEVISEHEMSSLFSAKWVFGKLESRCWRLWLWLGEGRWSHGFRFPQE